MHHTINRNLLLPIKNKPRAGDGNPCAHSFKRENSLFYKKLSPEQGTETRVTLAAHRFSNFYKKISPEQGTETSSAVRVYNSTRNIKNKPRAGDGNLFTTVIVVVVEANKKLSPKQGTETSCLEICLFTFISIKK